MTKDDDVNTPVIFAIGLLSVIVLVALSLLLQVMYYQTDAQLEQVKVIDRPAVELDNHLAEQQGKLASYAWVDAKKKVAAIPIDRAMELVLAELQRKQPAGGAGKEAEHGKP